MYNVWNFQQLEKLSKAEHFQNYFISNLLSISPAQLRRCGSHRNRSILGIAENKIIIFQKRTFFFNQIYLLNFFLFLAKLIFYSFGQTV